MAIDVDAKLVVVVVLRPDAVESEGAIEWETAVEGEVTVDDDGMDAHVVTDDSDEM